MDKKISERIRDIRRKSDITLKELSEKTQLSVSFLSQVERGVCSMTLTSLKKIAAALEIPVGDLVSVEEHSSFVSHRSVRKVNLEKSYSYMPVSGKFENRKLEGLILTMKPNFYDQEEQVHEGEEFYYVLSGTATFIINNEEYEISEGEVIHYPSNLPHRTINKRDIELVMLSVSTPAIF